MSVAFQNNKANRKYLTGQSCHLSSKTYYKVSRICQASMVITSLKGHRNINKRLDSFELDNVVVETRRSPLNQWVNALVFYREQDKLMITY